MDFTLSIFQKLQQRLIREESLPVAYTAILAAQALYCFNHDAREAAKRWAEGGSIADFSVAGSTVADIRDSIGGSEFQALCVLNAVETRYDAFADALLTVHTDAVEIDPDELRPDGGH